MQGFECLVLTPDLIPHTDHGGSPGKGRPSWNIYISYDVNNQAIRQYGYLKETKAGLIEAHSSSTDTPSIQEDHYVVTFPSCEECEEE